MSAYPLVREAFEIAREQGQTPSQVAKKAGLSRISPREWDRRGCCPITGNLEAFLNVLGKKLAIVDMED